VNVETSPAAQGFAALGLRGELLEALDELGHQEPTPIQKAAIPALLEGRDVLGQAATGTGKTAAFALPLLQRLGELNQPRRAVEPMALVLVPTRELAIQVSVAIESYGAQLGVRVIAVYGGQHPGVQLNALRRGVDVVVATPGRALDHLRRGAMDLSAVEVVVLDEADEMLDMGFAEDLEALLTATPSDRQTMLLSATMPQRLVAIASSHLRDPLQIRLTPKATPADELPRISQRAYVVPRGLKAVALARLLEFEAPAAAIVFCRTRTDVDEVTAALITRGERAEALHGGMDQAQRDRVMSRLRSGAARLLVATDVAARGLDIDHLTHVVNHDVPTAAESYVHRIGRVGRAGRQGVALTLVEPREVHRLKQVERLTRQPVEVLAVPSPEEVRSRQLARTVEEIRRTTVEVEVEPYRGALADLIAEVGLEAVALAAARLVHEDRTASVDDTVLPDLRPSSGPAKREPRSIKVDNDQRGLLSDRTRTAHVWVGLGRDAGVRPGDLVGAIANETRLTGKDIGTVRIQDHYSVVEVPASAEDEVIVSLGRTLIRGRKATVRRFDAARSPQSAKPYKPSKSRPDFGHGNPKKPRPRRGD
jgi:ATP-dependent RNA helicase DeaD